MSGLSDTVTGVARRQDQKAYFSPKLSANWPVLDIRHTPAFYSLSDHTLNVDGYGGWLGEKDSNPHAQIQNLMSYP